MYDFFKGESKKCLGEGLYLPAYECMLKCSHLFNMLDARSAISVNQRQVYIRDIRSMAVDCAKAFTRGDEINE